MRILIVEDERALCDTLSRSLKRKGYEIDACYDGDSALEWMLAEKYDLILLDLMLPGMRGDEVLRRGRQLTQAPFLVLSAVDSLESKVELLTPGGGRLHHQAL